MAEGKPSNTLRIGIVGGSIAGCAAAIELSRAGHDVSVFEKSNRKLKGRGAGIVTPITTLQALVARDLIAVDLAYLFADRQPFVGRSKSDDPQGHLAYAAPVNLALLNWSDFYQHLRARVPDDIYHVGRYVTGARMVDDKSAELSFAAGTREYFDLVVFADGYRSLGRSLLFPKTTMEYAGYSLWLGLLDEEALATNTPLEGAVARVRLAETGGHVVFHFVPGPNGSLTKGQRRVNWTCAIPLSIQELTGFRGKGDRELDGSLPAGSVMPAVEDRFKALVIGQLPSYYAQLIAGSRNTSIQPAYHAEMPAYHQGRFCFIGDAGTLTPPFSSSGVFKGSGSAIDLALALQEYDNVDVALAEWGQAQILTGRRLLTMARQMERALVWDLPDLSSMDRGQTAEWWQKAVTFPDEFGYAGSEE